MNTNDKTEHILLVADDFAVRYALAQVLAEEGYHVIRAANVEEALKFRNARIDLVLLDVNMPIRDGRDTCERLTVHNPLLPVIVITARPNQWFTALSSGVGALMEKPLDFTDLLASVRQLLSEPAAVRMARIAGGTAEVRYSPTQYSMS